MKGLKMKKVLLLSAIVVMSGCGTTQENSEVAANTDSGVKCFNEKTVGSNMRTRVCKTQAQLERERLEAEEYAKDARRLGTSGNVSGIE